jgi:hypothetical protein
MCGRQTLDLKPARAVADEDPVPGGALARSLLNQLLIDQPGLYRAEIA